MIERRYQIRRLPDGSWLLPGNDGQTYYRLWRYTEDGSAEQQDARGRWQPIRGMFWQVERYDGPAYRIAESLVPEDDYYLQEWTPIESFIRRRADAIQAALWDNESRVNQGS